MDTKTILLVGGGAAALYFLSKSGAGTRLPAIPGMPGSTLLPGGGSSANPTSFVPTVTGAPPPPAIYTQSYYDMYQYPAMKASNPNVANASYSLTTAEADQYIQNYNDINQWTSTVVPKNFPSKEDAARYHWAHYGPSEKRTFLPLMPQDLTPYVPAPANPSSSGGGGFLGTIKKVTGVVGSLLAILGVDDRLNDEEVKMLLEGAAIMNEIMPFYKQADPKLYNAIMSKMDTLVEMYTREL